MELGAIAYGPQIAAAAQQHGLDPRLLAAVAAQETGGPGASSGRNVVGDGGHGHGLFQIDDRSFAFAATPAAMDPARNADMAASILADDLHRYGGNVTAALSAYNAGSPTARGTTTTWQDGQTLGYASSVMRHYAALGGSPEALIADASDGAASVNSLGSLASGFAAGPTSAAPTESTPEPGFSLTLPSPPEGSFTPAPAMVYHPAGEQAAMSVGQAADALLGDQLDASDGLEGDETES